MPGTHTWLLLIAAATAAPMAPQAAPAATNLVEEVKSHHEGIAVWWVGNAGWLIKSDELLVGIDLDLEAGEKIRTPPVTATELAGLVDVVFATHHHGDHCNVSTIRTLAREGEPTLVLPRTCLKRVSDIPRERLIVPEPGEPFEVEGIRVEPLHAIHGNQEFTVLTREPDFVESIAHNCGYVLDIQGTRFFHPGDSVLTEEHLSLKAIDVLFVSPTVHNMYIDRSMILINHLEPSHIFPQHFGTYRQTDENAFWTRGYPDELKQRLSRELKDHYHKLQQGEMFILP
jgi:L-ascorbate 6-phosphate lactonase